MKKIITLLFAVAAIGSVQAQTSREEARKVVLSGSKGTTTTTGTEPRKDSPRDIILGTGTSTSSDASRQARIDEVNRDYDAKIYSIRNNPTLTAAEKEEAIARLERDRARKIRAIRNEGSEDATDDNKDVKKSNKKAKKAKSNNGNHYGWEKGKGNPHKNGGSPKDKKKG
jgi:hypothetical protein